MERNKHNLSGMSLQSLTQVLYFHPFTLRKSLFSRDATTSYYLFLATAFSKHMLCVENSAFFKNGSHQLPHNEHTTAIFRSGLLVN